MGNQVRPLLARAVSVFAIGVLSLGALLASPLGPSPTPAPLTAFTPLALAGLPLIDTELPPSTVITFVMFPAEGTTVLTYDFIPALVSAGR